MAREMSLVIHYLLLFFGSLIFLYMAVAILTYSIMLVMSAFQLRKRYKVDKHEDDDTFIDAFYSKPVSIIVPAHNEEAGILDNIYSLLNLRYPQTEIIIVDDGSTDGTKAHAISQFRMRSAHKEIQKELDSKEIKEIYQSDIHPHLWLIHKEQGGKADALNAGINFSRYPYFCSIDGDSILDEKSLLRVMKPMMASSGDVIGAGGNVRIANGFGVQSGNVFEASISRNALVMMQIAEYLRAFLMGRIALSTYNLNLIISGAFSVFSKKWVIAAGGYSPKSVGEDMELVTRMHVYIKEKKLNKRIAFMPDPICWTEAPEKMSVLRRQRRRWHQGLVESLWANKRVLFNPKYGSIGMIAFPYFWLIECLGPLIELGGYIYVGWAYFSGGIYYEFSILLILVFVLYGSLFTVSSLLLSAWSMNAYPRAGELFKLLLLSLTEVFWYRPLTLVWRCEGFIRSIMKKREWGQMKRVGLSRKGASS